MVTVIEEGTDRHARALRRQPRTNLRPARVARVDKTDRAVTNPPIVTSSDPNIPTDPNKGPLRASDPKILSPLGADAKRWPASPNHYFNWIDGIVANRDPIAPVDQAARSLQACATAWIAMKLGRKLTLYPVS